MDENIDIDPANQRRQEGFPIADPLQALRDDHEFVRKLFIRYLNTEDPLVMQQAGPRILQLLEMHTSLEESVFYPQVRSAASPLIDQCLADHDQADQLIRQLKDMAPDDDQSKQVFRTLCDAVLHHIEMEEHQLFPKLEQANLDLEEIGLQMQAFESNMVSTQARNTEVRR
jgi:hemerythrin superfamily protein